MSTTDSEHGHGRTAPEDGAPNAAGADGAAVRGNVLARGDAAPRRGVPSLAFLGAAGLCAAIVLGALAYSARAPRALAATRRAPAVPRERDRDVLASYDLSRSPARIPIDRAMGLVASEAARAAPRDVELSVDSIVGEEEAVLVPPPAVPPPIARSHRARVIVRLTTSEYVGRLADNVEYRFWAFNKSVPGPLIRVRQGDLVEVHLTNDPKSTMPHNIDFHACLGPGGGARASFTLPGKSTVFSFTAAKSGLYMYHCAVPPMPLHIANGMYGSILVEPENGMPRVDREYYLVQSEFYTKGAFGERGFQEFEYQKALSEHPTYIVFNGSAGSTTEEKALVANVGETVRLFVGNAGPGLVSSFHLIGQVFNRVYRGDAAGTLDTNVQTALIAPGSAAIVEFDARVPGMFEFVDHAVFRTLKGAFGHVIVQGGDNRLLYAGKIPEGASALDVCRAPGAIASSAPAVPAAPASGREIFTKICAACHQADGQGVPNIFPPLANSDFLRNERDMAIECVVFGHAKPIVVNGKTYNNIMPPQPLSDEEIANVLTYLRSHLGNSASPIAPKEVQKKRTEGPIH